jgi:CubicO group peptidase (beta-lactamase class C family)
MEFDGSWSLDSVESGFEKMEAGINARAIDYAKFGRLYLENGNWDGQQIIPAGWVVESTQIDPATYQESYYEQNDFGRFLYEDLGGYYKYMWYGYPRGGDAYDFAAEGDHGQIIYISPHKNLIVVRNGFDYGPDFGMSDWIKAFYEFAGEF